MGFFYEAVTQLRRRRPVTARLPTRKTAVVATGGGTPSSAVILQRADA